MESKKPLSPFQEVHKKVQDALDHAREVRERDAELRKKRAEEESVREGSTVPNSKLAPQLIADGNLKRCSVCGYPFQPDVKPSMSVAFSDHLLKAHKPGQTTEDLSQAAVRTVKEATDKV